MPTPDIKELDQEGTYKYLGVTKGNDIQHSAMKEKAIGLMAQLKEEPSNVKTKSSKTIHEHQLCMMYTCVL